ncbi:MAG TPA: histidine kinase [Steroidobacteraceae bacterium]|nr:histidine kinase [Steroidobacteraceae bacterium]
MARAAASVLDHRAAAQPAIMRTGAAGAGPAPLPPPPAVDRLIAGQYGRWLAVVGLWTALALLVAFGIYVSRIAAGSDLSLGSVLYATVPHFLAYALLSPALYRALYETASGERRGLGVSMLSAWGLIALAGSTAGTYFGLAVRDGFAPSAVGLIGSLVAPPLGPPFQAMNLSILLVGVAVLGLVLAARWRARGQWQAAQAELRGARLESQLAQARLQALQSQINPHFLLNSLNAISNLVLVGDRDRAFDAIGDLGELLRAAMRNGSATDVTLGEEVDFLRRYLQLCEVRFESRLRYRLSVPDSLRNRKLPALIIQPLVENAIRHGMTPQQVLTVDVRAFEQDGDIVIEVEDDGRGVAAGIAAPRTGHGLGNVAERLRLFYGDGARLSIEPRAAGGTSVRIRCPAA